MKSWRDISRFLALVAAGGLLPTPVRALVTLNDSHDHIYVSSSFGVSRDSNIFASNGSPGDNVYSFGLGISYARRAGWIGVNANIGMSASKFGKHVSENFSNPSYSLEFTKQSGRTTGSLTINAAKESRADAAVNVRTNAWNYSVGMNFRYPVVNRSTVTGGLSYSGHKYSDTSALTNLSSYASNLNWIYMLPRERDLVTGYRIRFGKTSRESSYTDQSFTLGLGGRLLAFFTGSLNVGYQVRESHGTAASQGKFGSWTASSSTKLYSSRRFTVQGSIAKDFAITATDSSVDSTTASVDWQYAFNRRWTVNGSGSWGDSRFLGDRGRIILSQAPLVLGPSRHDNFASWNANVGYTFNEHLSLSFGYSWFENWSTVSFSDFIRVGWSLSGSSKW